MENLGPWENYQNEPASVREARLLARAEYMLNTPQQDQHPKR